MKFLVIFLLAYFVNVNGQSRIAGGEVVQINQYPFSTALLTNRGTGTAYVQACGGTILTTSSILTAASCFYTDGVADGVSWWRARVGSPFANRQGTIYIVRRIEPHPEFSPTTLANDIAVINTTLSITFQWGMVQPASIAGGAYQLETNQPIWAIGWGAATDGGEGSEQLRHVQFWVVDQTTCANRYSAQGLTVTSNMVCTGWLDVGVRGQCQGDNGSPLVINGVVVGVHSWSRECTDGEFPGVNTRVAPYTRWIVSVATEPLTA
ncbi:trypsin, alkaline C-like [Pectinophora gossypiella]|uniref:Peptidase S1 domain-containing protein n=1 Tax=Pectinophora gossypiella TaxID=13191 RepID=A0A1E1WC82_PECGO|nr:trypsin, alkaline C-like [Pectinophora gossypiella]